MFPKIRHRQAHRLEDPPDEGEVVEEEDEGEEGELEDALKEEEVEFPLEELEEPRPTLEDNLVPK